MVESEAMRQSHPDLDRLAGELIQGLREAEGCLARARDRKAEAMEAAARAIEGAYQAGRASLAAKAYLAQHPTILQSFGQWWRSSRPQDAQGKAYSQATISRYERIYKQVEFDSRAGSGVTYPSLAACLRAFQSRVGKRPRMVPPKVEAGTTPLERAAASRKLLAGVETPELPPAPRVRMAPVESWLESPVARVRHALEEVRQDPEILEFAAKHPRLDALLQALETAVTIPRDEDDEDKPSPEPQPEPAPEIDASRALPQCDWVPLDDDEPQPKPRKVDTTKTETQLVWAKRGKDLWYARGYQVEKDGSLFLVSVVDDGDQLEPLGHEKTLGMATALAEKHALKKSE